MLSVIRSNSASARGGAGFLAFLILLLTAVWILKIYKSMQYGKLSLFQKISAVAGTVLLLGLLVIVIIPLFR